MVIFIRKWQSKAGNQKPVGVLTFIPDKINWTIKYAKETKKAITD